MPEAILLQDVETLGEQGKVIDVSKGYLRNYLVPRKLAQPATKGAIEVIRERQQAAERAALSAVEKAQENVNLLNRTDRPRHRHRGTRSARAENRQTGRAHARADQERRYLHDRSRGGRRSDGDDQDDDRREEVSLSSAAPHANIGSWGANSSEIAG
jgi:hypothetical protein